MKLTIPLCCLMVLAAANGPAVLAQPVEPMVNFKYEVQAARNRLDKERRMVLVTELRLTPDEKDAFWPVYNEYSAELRRAGDIYVDLIGAYAANYDRMTDEFANRMLNDYIRYTEEMIKVRKKYLRRFKSILPATKVARLYQVENKLQAVFDFNLAARIPLIQDARPE